MSKLFKVGDVSPVEVAKACLAQITRLDGDINAMSFLNEKATMKQAKASEKRWKDGKPRGPLDGVPLLIKDLLLVKGWPTLRGSKTVAMRTDFLLEIVVGRLHVFQPILPGFLVLFLFVG